MFRWYNITPYCILHGFGKLYSEFEPTKGVFVAATFEINTDQYHEVTLLNISDAKASSNQWHADLLIAMDKRKMKLEALLGYELQFPTQQETS